MEKVKSQWQHQNEGSLSQRETVHLIIHNWVNDHLLQTMLKNAEGHKSCLCMFIDSESNRRCPVLHRFGLWHSHECKKYIFPRDWLGKCLRLFYVLNLHNIHFSFIFLECNWDFVSISKWWFSSVFCELLLQLVGSFFYFF